MFDSLTFIDLYYITLLIYFLIKSYIFFFLYNPVIVYSFFLCSYFWRLKKFSILSLQFHFLAYLSNSFDSFPATMKVFGYYRSVEYLWHVGKIVHSRVRLTFYGCFASIFDGSSLLQFNCERLWDLFSRYGSGIPDRFRAQSLMCVCVCLSVCVCCVFPFPTNSFEFCFLEKLR